MEQRIIGFHQDEHGDWVADLECGHGQHVRHNPPWSERAWVVTQHGREQKLGETLFCKKWDEVALDALVEVICGTLNAQGYSQMIWDHVPSEPTQSTSPDAKPLIDRLQYWDPAHPPPVDEPPEASHN